MSHRVKALVTLALLTLVASCTGAGSGSGTNAASESAPASGSAAFASEAHGYTVTLPEGWTARGGEPTASADVSIDTFDGPDFTQTVQIFSQPAADASVEEVLEAEGPTADCETTDEGTRDVAGETATTIEFMCGVGHNNDIVAVAEHGDHVFAIHMTSSARDPEADRAAFDEFVSGFQFTD